MRDGLSAPVIWRDDRGAVHASADAPEGEAHDWLEVREVRADGNRVYFDVAHSSATANVPHQAGTAELFIREGHCHESKALVSGSIWRDMPTPSTVSASLSDLPDGELQLTLRAFGVEESWMFLKEGKSIRELPLEERSGYTVIPADPVHGIPETKAIIVTPCPDEVKP